MPRRLVSAWQLQALVQDRPRLAEIFLARIRSFRYCPNSVRPQEARRKALEIREAALPHFHPRRARLLEDYANLLEAMGRASEARRQASLARESHAVQEAAFS